MENIISTSSNLTTEKTFNGTVWRPSNLDLNEDTAFEVAQKNNISINLSKLLINRNIKKISHFSPKVINVFIPGVLCDRSHHVREVQSKSVYVVGHDRRTAGLRRRRRRGPAGKGVAGNQHRWHGAG